MNIAWFKCQVRRTQTKKFPNKNPPMGDNKIRPYSQCGKEKELDCEAAVVFSLSYSYTFVMFYFFSRANIESCSLWKM